MWPLYPAYLVRTLSSFFTYQWRRENFVSNTGQITFSIDGYPENFRFQCTVGKRDFVDESNQIKETYCTHALAQHIRGEGAFDYRTIHSHV